MTGNNIKLDLNKCCCLSEAELAHLRKVFAGNAGDTNDAHVNVIKKFLADVDSRSSAADVAPEGGHHNQWYQCEDCQLHLETLDATHHRCNSCGRIYSGWPYDNCLYKSQHFDSGQLCDDAAVAWAISGQRKYLDMSRAVLLAFSDMYTRLPRIAASSADRPVDSSDKDLYLSGGHLTSQTLDESMIMVNAARAADMLIATDELTDDEIKAIKSGLIRPMIDSIAANSRRESNWQSWHNAAMLAAAAVLGDHSLAERALYDDENGFFFQMKTSVLPEGPWYENSWGYHYYTLQAMTHIAETVRRLGGDIYSNPQLKAMYLAVFDFIMPNGQLPRFGDCKGPGNYRVDMVNEAAMAAYNDDRLASALPAVPTLLSLIHQRDTNITNALPSPKSCIKPTSGQAILHCKGSAAVLNFGPYGGFHGHFDKLSFVYHRESGEIAVDPGCAASQAYRLPIHTQWYKSTISHNAVMVDGCDQNPVTGKLLDHHFTDDFSVAVASADGLFETMAHQRLLMLTEEALIILDHLKSTDGQSHRIDWLQHNMASKGKIIETQDLQTISPDCCPCAGSGYFQNVNSCKIDTGAKIVFDMPGDKQCYLSLASAPAAPAALTTADGPLESVQSRCALVDLAINCEEIYIAAVISLSSEAAIETASDNGVNASFVISDGKKTYKLTTRDGSLSEMPAIAIID